MRAMRLVLSVAAALLLAAFPIRAAVTYPLALTLDAQLKAGVTTVTSKLTVQVDRSMVDATRARVTDALRYSGYSNFVNALRTAPVVGTIATQSAKVDIRYTREEQDGANQRLILVADRPLFFLSADPAKPRAGFELTVMDLRIGADGTVTGTMAGAAKVKPSPNGPVLSDFTESMVELKGTVGKP
jgi:hypothetical protein